MSTAPRFDIDVDSFWRDPYPALAQMRAEAPIAFVPQLGATLLTRRDDIALDGEAGRRAVVRPTGRAHEPLDGPEHDAQGRRRAHGRAQRLLPRHRARGRRGPLAPQFQRHADRIVDGLAGQGRGDLIDAFALPLSAECLKSMTGLINVRYQDMDAWSQAMIQGIANYDGDPDVERRCNEATAAIDAAIDDVLPVVRRTPDHSLLSVMLEGGLSEAQTRANVKLTISGGQNEPRKAIAGTIWALLTHPDALQSITEGRATWMQAFDELTRWISPIGMSPRRVAKPWTVEGVDLEVDDRVFLMFGSANRDETHFAEADRFEVARNNARSIVFGAGPHFCAGAAAARSMVADVALPTAFSRLRGLRLDDAAEVRIGGWAFRGLLTLPVEWDE